MVCLSAESVLLFELISEVHILLLGLILTHTLLAVPGVPLGFSLNILYLQYFKNKDMSDSP